MLKVMYRSRSDHFLKNVYYRSCNVIHCLNQWSALSKEVKMTNCDFDAFFKLELELNKLCNCKKLHNIFSVRMNNEEVFFLAIPGHSVSEVIKGYQKSNHPFIDMSKYGTSIQAYDFASIQQSDMLGYSLEFDEDNDSICISDGESFVYASLKKILSIRDSPRRVNAF